MKEEKIMSDFLQEISERAKTNGIPYYGLASAAETWAVLQQTTDAILIDVRTQAEFQFVGHVPDSVLIEWKSFPGMKTNEHFLEQLQKITKKDQIIFLLCRTGARSHDAALAATAIGYTHLINIEHGFEGDKNAAGHRGCVNGWKASALPWIQS
ncbi:rhodanese-like domain-containing protein [Neisseria sp. Ec49-e6-T10]|uniref:rhodanese-like domain-containing protein n=1 Tax=Neisseria sp. Ec49-e6-T10 TaxID=3140744 RepID=UPI003EBB8F35